MHRVRGCPSFRFFTVLVCSRVCSRPNKRTRSAIYARSSRLCMCGGQELTFNYLPSAFSYLHRFLVIDCSSRVSFLADEGASQDRAPQSTPSLVVSRPLLVLDFILLILVPEVEIRQRGCKHHVMLHSAQPSPLRPQAPAILIDTAPRRSCSQFFSPAPDVPADCKGLRPSIVSSRTCPPSFPPSSPGIISPERLLRIL